MSVVRRPRIEVEVFAAATVRQRRELGAFARYCIGRIEHDIGIARAWSVKLITEHDIYACTVLVVDDSGLAVRTTRSGPDPTLAMWDAMCKIELLVLETRQPLAATESGEQAIDQRRGAAVVEQVVDLVDAGNGEESAQ